MKILILGGSGYIGSKFKNDFGDKYEIDGIDLNWYSKQENIIETDYKYLRVEKIKAYDAIILLAGHSSVGMCKNEMLSTFRNNVQNFCELLEKIEKISQEKKIKFIYASSSSVYGSNHDKLSIEDSDYFKPHNYYDLSKQEIDYYASLSKNVEYYGLRFGTVNGWSPNTRVDIMLNAMRESAINEKTIKCFNQENYRPILYINDLTKAIDTILQNKDESKKGIYNLISFNSSIKEIVEKASEYLKTSVKFENSKDGNTYSFSASNQKFENMFNFKFLGSVESILKSFEINGNFTKTKRTEPRRYE